MLVSISVGSSTAGVHHGRRSAPRGQCSVIQLVIRYQCYSGLFVEHTHGYFSDLVYKWFLFYGWFYFSEKQRKGIFLTKQCLTLLSVLKVVL